MDTIYQGLTYAVDIKSAEEPLNEVVACLYNKATNQKFEADSIEVINENYRIASWNADTTAQMAVGLYSLDVIETETQLMKYHIESSIICAESSKSER